MLNDFLTLHWLVIAYLDPGTGSFILQIIAAGFLGLLLTLRLFREQVSHFFRRLLGKTTPPSEDNPE